MIPTGQRHIRTYSKRHVSPFADMDLGGPR
jgi:hypothetical protein